MSRGFAQRTVKFINKAGTYTVYLQCSQGDLWQTYTKNGANYENIVPNYASIQPIVRFAVISSRSAGQTGLNGHPTWYFGDVHLNSGSTISSGKINNQNISDYFELVAPSSGQPYYGLKIKNNLPILTSGSSVTLKAEGEIGGTSDTIHAEAGISIMPATSNGVHVSILDITQVSAGVVGRNFTFTEEGQNITLRADVYEGTGLVTSGIAYVWQKISNGQWNSISGATNRTLTIYEDDVMTYQQYRCVILRNNSLLGYGTANVMDATDPFVINPNPNPMDETIEDAGDEVSYTPAIVSRDSGTTMEDLTKYGFMFVYTSSDGVDQTPSALKDGQGNGKPCQGTGANDKFITSYDGSTQVLGASSHYPVDYTICNNYGDISVSIETVADLKDYD